MCGCKEKEVAQPKQYSSYTGNVNDINNFYGVSRKANYSYYTVSECQDLCGADDAACRQTCVDDYGNTDTSGGSGGGGVQDTIKSWLGIGNDLITTVKGGKGLFDGGATANTGKGGSGGTPPKLASSNTTMYVVGGVAVVALIVGGIFLMKSSTPAAQAA